MNHPRVMFVLTVSDHPYESYHFIDLYTSLEEYPHEKFYYIFAPFVTL